jgi:hypothetical protein
MKRRSVANAIHQLSGWEVTVIGDCLHAAARGPFFFRENETTPLGAFHPIFGLNPDELKLVADAWPNVGHLDPSHVEVAVTNAINNLVNYPHRHAEAWADYISVDRNEALAVLGHWNELTSHSGGIR